MKLSTKRKLDNILGSFFLSVLGVLARFLGKILNRTHSIEPAQKILVLKFQGIGSLTIAEPALSKLKKLRPESQIWFWGTKSTATLAPHFNTFDRVLCLEDQNLIQLFFSFIKNIIQIWKFKPDWAFDFEVYSKLSSILTLLTLARNRGGFAVDQVRQRKDIHTHLVSFNRYRYLGESYERLLGLLGNQTQMFPLNPWPWKLDQTPLLEQKQPYIVLHVHAGDLSLERRWPLDQFKLLALKLVEAYPKHDLIFTFYGKLEENYLRSLPHHVRIFKRQYPLPEFIKLLAHASLVISNDSGPLHLALTTQTKVLALFGPTRPQAYLNPERKNLIALSTEIFCSPCIHHWDPPPCAGDNQCLKGISVDTVFEKASLLLDQNFEQSFTAKELPWTTHAQSEFYPGLIYERN